MNETKFEEKFPIKLFVLNASSLDGRCEAVAPRHYAKWRVLRNRPREKYRNIESYLNINIQLIFFNFLRFDDKIVTKK
jgi:hypothetical protein